MSMSNTESDTKSAVLVVDDRPENILAMQEVLEPLAGEVVTALSAEEAFSKAVRQQFAVILLDVRMPGIDGLEAAAMLRRNESTKHVPIIFVTADGRGPEMAFKGYEAGAVDYLEKPIDPVLLRSKVSVFLELDRRWRLLQQKNRELEELVNSKTRFLATVGHELRTPLTSVVGFATVLQDTDTKMSTDEKSEMLEIIINQGLDLAAIIDDLLVMARCEMGQLELIQVSVNLRAQTAQVIEAIRPTDQITIHTPDGDVMALGDPGRIRQIIRNLVTNAIKYGDGEIHIQIRDTGTETQLDVIDNGPGVPEGQEERIFEPYQRAHTAVGTTESFGIGLAVARDLARAMGGNLSYHRDECQTVFRLTVPCHRPDNAVKPVQTRLGSPLYALRDDLIKVK